MWTRRSFIRKSALATGALLAGNGLLQEALAEERERRLIILHTNDVHSRLEPFPMDGSRNEGLGGVAARAEQIRAIRSTGEQVLLLDSGDIFQGTPYFNFYNGEPEIKAMTAMGYDACTMGNHDFDGGIENFANQLRHASFPVLICNYDFSQTPMEYHYQPYKIFEKGKIRVGVTGVGIALEGLVPENKYGNTKYLEPIEQVSRVAEYLKRNKKCDLVVCLSHLGYKYANNTVSDEILAKESEHIDVILGGHTHTFFDAPVVYKNKSGKEVVVNQVGWAGIVLGRMDFSFQRNREKNLETFEPLVIGKKTRE